MVSGPVNITFSSVHQDKGKGREVCQRPSTAESKEDRWIAVAGALGNYSK